MSADARKRLPRLGSGGMEITMRKLVAFMLSALLLTTPAYAVETLPEDAINIQAPYAVLMEKSTGTVL